MRHLLMIAGAAALVATTPALSQGRGHGNPHGNRGHSAQPRAHPHGCPPGLAARGCMPPGQARRLFNIGQRVPSSFRYSNIPAQYRDQISYDPRYRYTYNDGQVYVVDRRTRLVQSIVDLVR
jgi:hypothetical protein